MSRNPSIPVWLLSCIILARAAVVGLAVRQPQVSLTADSYQYLTLAHSLATHHIFSQDPANPNSAETVRTPGYPLFLAPVVWSSKSPVLSIVILQAMIGILICLGLWQWLAPRASIRGANAAVLFLAFDPVALFHTPSVLAETLLTGLVTLSLIVTWNSLSQTSPPKTFLSGILWGLCAMVKPVGLYIAFFLSWLWVRRPILMILFLCAAYLLPGLWVVRNKERAHFNGFTSLGGAVLLQCPAASIESYRTGQTPTEASAVLFARVRAEHHGSFTNVEEENKAYTQAAVSIMRAHPWLLWRVHVQGAARILFGPGSEMFIDLLGKNRRLNATGGGPGISGSGTLALYHQYPWLFPLIFLYPLALAGFYGLFILGCSHLWRSGQVRESLLLLGAVFYFVGIASHQGYYRFRIPIMPFVAAGAAYAFGTRGFSPQRRKHGPADV